MHNIEVQKKITKYTNTTNVKNVRKNPELHL